MRLPVNLFLYAISTGLLGLAGYNFMQSLQESDGALRTKISESGIKEAEERLSKGKGDGPSNFSWNYQTAPWKARFMAPNLVGKDLRKADETATAIKEVEQPKVADVRPLSDVIELVSLMCDTATDGKGGQSHVIIRYKDAASVQPPNWYLLENQTGSAASAPVGAADGVGGRAGGRPGGGRPAGGRPGASTQVPTSSAGQDFIQRVWVVGDGSARNEATLWPPFQDVRLVRVAADARSAYFVRGGTTQPVEGQDPATLPKPLEEEVFKTSLEISEDVMRAVVEIQRGDEKQPREVRTAAAPEAASGWKDVEETTLVGNKVFISKKDQQLMQESPETFMDRINVDSYVSRTGSGLRGLRVLNVAPELTARYGVQSNDLILSVNGEPVSTKADAMAVGKRQYNRGTRTFVVKLLSDGREVERIIEAPNR
jgi:hypothetical protein